jgi:hypothetical protein
MAERVSRRRLVRAAEEHAAEVPMPAALGMARRRAGAPPSSPHSDRFRAATAVLVGLAVGAFAIAIGLLAYGGDAGPAPSWSAWRPPDSGNLGASEIAARIAPFYRISAVDQLDVVTLVNLSSASASATSTAGATSSATSPSGALRVAVRTDPSSSGVSLLSGHTIAYDLCGIGGSSCSIGPGKASADRLLLLRREALELALYTFKYISGTANVVTILPPGTTQQGCVGICPKPSAAASTKPLDIALLFLRDELKPWLTQPLRDTLALPFPPSGSELRLWRQTPEAGLVDQITAHGLFSERLVHAQDASSLILLDPLPPQ